MIGGGIVGAGIARDAAMRGLGVGLVEQYDVAFGTSSRSSRLLHGGLRYLAQGRIAQVYAASREKRILHRIAPHLAVPLPFLFPSYRGEGWPLWKLRIGVRLYDLLCGGHNLGPSTSISRRQTLSYLPGLNPENLSGAVRYYDGLTSDAHLVIDTLRSAAAHGAIVANYSRWERGDKEASAWQSSIRDSLADRTYSVWSRAVVNATGPWADNPPQSSIRLRRTKGVHLVIDRARLDVSEAVVMAEEGRILFAIPWGKRVILGIRIPITTAPSKRSVPSRPTSSIYYRRSTAVSRGGAVPTADVRSTWAGLRLSSPTAEGRRISPGTALIWHAPSRLARRGRRQAHDLSADRRGDRKSARTLSARDR